MKDPLARAASPIMPFHPSDEESGGHADGPNGTTAKVAPIAPRGIDSFLVPADGDATILLGNRYLCRGDGLVMVSSSGMGKSALAIQAAVTWAFGLPFMGIMPNGCLRSIIIQSEDSDGDIGEVWASICHKMNLTTEQRKTASERVVIVSDRVNRGLLFLAELKRQLAAAKYDLVWINPLAAYVSGDATSAEAAGEFLRGGLNGLNADASFGYIVVHHTTKPATGKENRERKWFEVMYDMAGSYDIIGWARSIISLRPTDTIGEFNLVLAKRGMRAGVTKKVPAGAGYRLESTISIPIKHCHEKMTVPGIARELSVIFWEAREELAADSPIKSPDRGGRPAQHSFSDFVSIMPVGRKNGLGFRPLHRIAAELKPVGRGSFERILDEAVAKQMLVCDISDPAKPCYYVPERSSVNPEETLGFEQV